MNRALKTLSYIFVIIGLISLIVSFCFLFFSKSYFKFGESFNLEIANQFGGFIAGVAGIFFTGTGTFLVFLTFEQQREQFKLSQFESSFFNLLSHLELLIENISGVVQWRNIVDPSVYGRKYFYFQIRELNDLIHKKTEDALKNTESKYYKIAIHFMKDVDRDTLEPFDYKLFEEYIKELYEEFYKSRYSYLGHYFRFVYNVIKYVDESQLSYEYKKKYVGLIQAQMTSDELGLIFYNGIGKYGNEKLFPLLEKYAFLSNIDKRVLIFSDYLIKLYPRTNFNFLSFEKEYEV
jgi:hypothetical protein